VSCYTSEGIDAIKEALLAGENAGTAEAPVKIKLIAPPLFVVTCTTLDKDFGIALLKRAIEVVETTIKAKG
jgi:translation initiation factor 2 subunit 1